MADKNHRNLKLPRTLTPEALKDGLRFSISTRRRLLAALIGRDRQYWAGKSYDEEVFYTQLLNYLAQTGGWDSYNQVAVRIQKRKRPLVIGPAFHRTTMDDLMQDQQFVSKWPEIRKLDDPPIEIVRFLLHDKRTDRAANLAWGLSHGYRKQVNRLCEEHSELAELIGDSLASMDAAGDNELPECVKHTTDVPLEFPLQPVINWEQGVARLLKVSSGLSKDHPDSTALDEIEALLRALRQYCTDETSSQELRKKVEDVLETCRHVLGPTNEGLVSRSYEVFFQRCLQDATLVHRCLTLAQQLAESKALASIAQHDANPLEPDTLQTWVEAAAEEQSHRIDLVKLLEPLVGQAEAAGSSHSKDSKSTLAEPEERNISDDQKQSTIVESTEIEQNEDEVTSPFQRDDREDHNLDAQFAARTEESKDFDTDVINWVEQHLRAGRLSEAYWLAWSKEQIEGTAELPSALLGLVASARAQAPGDVASADASGFFDQSMELTLDSCTSILASAAVIPFALFCPHPPPEGVFTLASQLRTGSPELDGLIEDVTSSCLHHGQFLTSATIHETDPSAEKEERLRSAQSDAKDFLDHIPHISITWRPAAEAFRDWFREGQPLRRALRAVAEDNRSEAGWVETYMEEDFDPEAFLENIRSGRKYKGRNIAQVQGTARQKLLHHLAQFRTIVETWLEAQEQSSAGTSGADAASLKAFKRRITAKLPSVLEEVRGGLDDIGIRGAVLNVVDDVLSRLQTVLNGEATRPAASLTSTLIRLRDVALSFDMSPPDDQQQILAIHDALSSPPQDFTTAELVETLLFREEFARALAVVESFADDDLRRRVNETIDKIFSQTTKRLQDAETAVEDAYLLGLLREDSTAHDRENGELKPSRSILMAKLYDARQVVSADRTPSAIDLARASEAASEVLTTVQGLKKNRERRFSQELSELLTVMRGGSPDDNEDAQYLESQAELFKAAGDVIAFGELVSQAKAAQSKGARIERMSIAARAKLHDFLAKDEDLGRDWSRIEIVAQAINRREYVGPVSFEDKDLDYCKRAAQAFKHWGLLAGSSDERKRREVIRSVHAILEFLNFPLKQPSGSSTPVTEQQFLHLKVELSEPITTSPIPAFGSGCFPRLDVVVCPAKVQARVLADFLKRRGLLRTPVVVLHRPTVSKSYRFEFRAHASRMHLTALLIDFSLLLYATGSGDPLPTLLELGLPFLWSQPYQMQGDLVPREMFVGRSTAVREVSHPDGTSVVYGGRQLGKSALLRHVKAEFNRPAEGTYVIYRDIDDLGGNAQTFEEMEAELWRRIAEELTHVGFFNSQIPRTQKKARLAERVQQQIRDRFETDPNCRLIVLLDEADDLLDLDAKEDFHLTKQIRSLMGQTHRRFKVVFAGLQSVQRFYNYKNHPFAQLGRGYPITPLPPDAAFELVTNPLRVLGFEFAEPALVYRILSQANYHPGLVQIFCFRLLERLYGETGNDKEVIRAIERHDVVAIERDPEFQAEIRSRFDWTLDLDDRYKVLVYALVISGEPTAALTESEFLSLGRFWWPRVFDEVDHQTARSLLEELVGLGVLISEVVDGVQRYRLRSPNLLRLLGPEEEITAELSQLISRGSARKPNPSHFRKLLDKSEASFSTLTMEQASQIVHGDNDFRVILIRGSRPLGLHLVSRDVEAVLSGLSVYDEKWEPMRFPIELVTRGPEEMVASISRQLKPQKRSNKFGIVEPYGIDGPDSLVNFLVMMLDDLPRFCHQTSRGLMVVLLDPAIMWKTIGHPDLDALLMEERVSMINLRRWSDGSLSKALEDLQKRSKPKDHGEAVFAATDGIHVLCEHILKAAKSSNLSAYAPDALAAIVSATSGEPYLVVNTGSPGLAAAVTRIQDLAGGDEVPWDTVVGLLRDELPSSEPVLADGGVRLRSWLLSSGFVGTFGQDGNFRICRHLRAEP